MPSLLYLVHRVPYPPNRGDRIRSYHLLRHLVQSYDVHLATLCDEPVSDETRAVLRGLCRRVEIAPVMGWRRWLRASRSLATGRTATEGLFDSPQLHRTVRAWGAETKFDAAVVFCSSMLPYVNCPELRDVPTIVDLVDVDSQKWFDYAAQARGPKRWLFELEGRRMRNLERQCVERAKAVTLVSDAEAELFRSVCPNDRTYGIPNGVDLDYFRPVNDGPNPWTPLPAADRTNAVFVGALDYRANIDGVTWFASEVWPLVRQRLPNLTLGLVGRNPAPAIQRLESVPGIRVFGTVPDVRPYVAAADFVIAPLRIARGIQNKVLEAMAMGKPVLASPQALEGIGSTSNHDVWQAISVAEWSDRLVQLFGDKSRRTRLAGNGRQYVQRHHNWVTCLQPLGELLNSRQFQAKGDRSKPVGRLQIKQQAISTDGQTPRCE